MTGQFYWLKEVILALKVLQME